MAHIAAEQKKILTRVRRIKGQVNALELAVEEHADCYAVLQQIAAIRGAVNGLMNEMLEGHIKEHLAKDGISTEEKEKALAEVLTAIKSFMK